LQGIRRAQTSYEPDLFVSIFDSLLVHDYRTGETAVYGNPKRIDEFYDLLKSSHDLEAAIGPHNPQCGVIDSNFSKQRYLDSVKDIKERIRSGYTYQTNLTQQLRYRLPAAVSSAQVFTKLRNVHPAPFSAIIERKTSTVISASPERFFRVENNTIEASPIKGTRPRGRDEAHDVTLLNELVTSEKDHAENTMIVDLLRNDLGRVCDYGSVKVTSLCEVQTLPSVFHLVSTIQGELRRSTKPSELIRALFPCGSITGAPKISTMRIINELETKPRGLSMGAIGVYIPRIGFDLPAMLDLSVAIRTMVIRNGEATFNVGGGVTIESDPEMEYEESWSRQQPYSML
jgi:para-aminobenzoate synthetase component 1